MLKRSHAHPDMVTVPLTTAIRSSDLRTCAYPRWFACILMFARVGPRQ